MCLCLSILHSPLQVSLPPSFQSISLPYILTPGRDSPLLTPKPFSDLIPGHYPQWSCQEGQANISPEEGSGTQSRRGLPEPLQGHKQSQQGSGVLTSCFLLCQVSPVLGMITGTLILVLVPATKRGHADQLGGQLKARTSWLRDMKALIRK